MPCSHPCGAVIGRHLDCQCSSINKLHTGSCAPLGHLLHGHLSLIQQRMPSAQSGHLLSLKRAGSLGNAAPLQRKAGALDCIVQSFSAERKKTLVYLHRPAPLPQESQQLPATCAVARHLLRCAGPFCCCKWHGSFLLH